jgi:hypothetical protein
MTDLIYETRNLMLMLPGKSLTEPGYATPNEMVENAESLTNNNPSFTK